MVFPTSSLIRKRYSWVRSLGMLVADADLIPVEVAPLVTLAIWMHVPGLCGRSSPHFDKETLHWRRQDALSDDSDEASSCLSPSG